MPVIDRSPLVAIQQPYPGLRAFETHESFLFFGREIHTEELLRRLSENRFLAVVGSSGGGKSSLVRAGLLPALYRGYLIGATSQWRIAVMRPGGAPISALAAALADTNVLGVKEDPARQKTLRASSLGLVHAVRGAALRPRESLLLVVDQFEELFRFAGEKRGEAGTESALFVSLLLQAAGQPEVPIYVVLTMRSDFLGDCAQFPGLPEALNRGQYLIPRLTREQRQQSIERPLHLAAIDITPRLVQRLLNEAGDDPDQLPVLQHALLRTFRRWQDEGANGSIDLSHYETAGGIAHALDNHANEIYAALAEPDQTLTAKIFRCLTTVEGGRAVRRPARFDRLCQVAGAMDSAVTARAAAILKRFAQRENSLLLCSAPELVSETVIDISHESLIRKWDRLKEWVTQEAKSADWYRDLARDVLRHRNGEAGLYRDPDLSRTLHRSSEEGWNQAWANQYWPAEQPSFDEIQKFLSLSDQTQRAEREREKARQQKELDDARRLAWAHKRVAMLTGLLLLMGIIAAGLIYYVSWRNQQQIEEQTRRYLQIQGEHEESLHRAESLQSDLEKTRRELRTASEEDRRKLETQLKQLEIAYRDSKTEADRVRSQLKGVQSSPALQTSDHGTLLKQISDLQEQLTKVTNERDDLQSQMDTFQTVRIRDAPYWQSRASQAENELKAAMQRVNELLQRLVPPAIVALPQYSVVHLKEPSLANRVALCVGDMTRQKSSRAWVWVWTSNGKELLPSSFQNDQKRAMELVGPLEKEGCKSDASQGRWCYVAQKEQIVSQAQELGSFRLGGVPYSVVANGWQSNPTAGTDVISVVVYPTPQGAGAKLK